MERRATCSRTGKAGRPKPKATSCLIISAVLALCPACTVSPDELYQSGQSLYRQGDFAQARQKAEEGYRRFRTKPESPWHWKFRVLAAELQLLNGDTSQADSLLKADPPANFSFITPRYLMLRGYSLSRHKKYPDAQGLLKSAIAAARARGDHETESDAWLFLGTSFLSQSDLTSADLAFASAQVLAQSNGLNYQNAGALLDRGLVQIKRERYGDAIPFLEQARILSDRSGLKLLSSFAAGNLADCYESVGDLDRALEILKHVIEIQKQSGLATSLSNSYSELGAIYLRKGQTEPAISAFRQALEAVHEDAPVQYAQAAGNLARVLADTGSPDQAEHFNQTGAQLLSKDDLPSLASFALTDASIATHRGQKDRALLAYQKAINLGSAVPSVLWQADAGAAGIYASKDDFPNAAKNYENALQVIAANREDQLKSDYKITFLSSLIRFYQDYVALLMGHGDSRRALEIADSSRASVLTEGLLGNSEANRAQLLNEIQKAAKASHSVFLFYWLAPQGSYVWAIGGTQTKAAVLADQRQIIRDAESYRTLIEEEKRDPLVGSNQVGARLYQELVAPVADSISPGSRVVIVPDGVLHNLNFETLIVEKPESHYWIEDATILVAPSLGIVRTGKSVRSAKRSLLLIGNPLTDGTGYQPLPEAALEIRQIERRFKTSQTSVFTGAQADVASFGAAQPGKFSTIHFATHVDANEQSPLDSAIILSPRPNGFKLYARDVAGTQLTADLVTISACRGAGVRALSGEGLVGFAWAFFQAGARNVVTSLWDVYDNSTAVLMDDFYAGVETGDSYASALRAAKLKMLRTGYKRPYYWAPFQLYSRTVGY